MKTFSHILIVSAENECSNVIRKVSKRRLDESNIFRVDDPTEGLSVLNKIGLVDSEIPVCIFLSTEIEQVKIKSFLDLLDRDYPEASRGKVILVNSRLQLNDVMKLAVSEAVGHFINCPVLPIEVESVLSTDVATVGIIA